MRTSFRLLILLEGLSCDSKTSVQGGSTLKIATNKDYDYVVGKVIALFLLLDAVNIAVKSLAKPGLVTNYLSLFIGCVYVLYLLFQYRRLEFILPKLVIFEMVFAVLLIWSMTANSSGATAIFAKCRWVIAFCIPMYTMALYVKDSNRLLVPMERVSWVILGIGCVMFLFFWLVTPSNEYSMSFSYMLLPAVLLHINMAFNRTPVMWFPVMIEIAFIVMYGSRGPLLCAAAFFLYKSVSYGSTLRRIQRTVLLVVAVTLIIFLQGHVLRLVAWVCDWLRIDSRTVHLFLTSRALYDSGRSEGYSFVWSQIADKPLFGLGVAGEVPLMTPAPHFLFLELMLHFGVWGGLVSLLIVYSFLRSAVQRRITDCWMVFFCSGFLPLLLSSSYLQEPKFWVLMALCSRPKGRNAKSGLTHTPHREPSFTTADC